jgi:hypothetical protein
LLLFAGVVWVAIAVFRQTSQRGKAPPERSPTNNATHGTASRATHTPSSDSRGIANDLIGGVTQINAALAHLVESVLGEGAFLGQLRVNAMFDVERVHLAAKAMRELHLSLKQAVALLIVFEGLCFERSMTKRPRQDELEMQRSYMALAQSVGPILTELEDVKVNAFSKRVAEAS